MIPRRLLGLRGRLVAALLLTSAVTLATAAVALLTPLERRLEDNELESLTATAVAAAPSFAALDRQALTAPSRRLKLEVRTLRRRTDAQVAVVDAASRALAGTDVDPGERVGEARLTLAAHAPRSRIVQEEGLREAQVEVPVVARGGRLVLVLRQSLDQAQGAAGVVRRALAVAALIGLAIALLVGLLLATRLVRRLTALRDTALLVARLGSAPEVQADGVRDEVGDLTRAFATMQTRLGEQEKARRALVATASHELRTPVASLHLMLGMLEEDLRAAQPDLEGAREQVRRAEIQASRIANLASELLDLSQLDAGVPPRRELVEVTEVARAVVAEFATAGAERGGAVELQAADASWAIADPGSVARILRLLIDNALRFTRPGGTVRISVSGSSEVPSVSVADDGPGVPPDERDMIFERFRRGSVSGGEGGFGLGLAIGRELAERMGGALRLKDVAAGATFTLELEPAPAPSA